MPITSLEHIDVDDRGMARIVGHRTKVIQIVMDKRANNWSPEEIHAQYAQLSLAQIHAAFAYYYDHQADLDAQIDADHKAAEQARQQAGPSDVAKKLRATGKLS